MIEDTPRKRGRPRKDAPKPPPKGRSLAVRTGPNSVWTRKTRTHPVCAPVEFFELFRKQEFKKELNDLIEKWLTIT